MELHLDLKDEFPGRPRILFVGLANSTHTHSWIDLLDGCRFNVRLYAIANTEPPPTFACPTFTFSRLLPQRSYLTQLEIGLLAQVVQAWKPDVVHSLGLAPASYLFYAARQGNGSGGKSRWIVTARGGPELALNRCLPEERPRISAVLESCDLFMADNAQNYEYASELGLPREKACSLGRLPGTGGMDVGALSALSSGPPSRRQRMILWPKAYECPASKALPVFEALRLCWDRIRPCRIHMTAMCHDEVKMWFRALPEEIRYFSYTHDRLPRRELLELTARSRVLLAPSLADGVPNTLYEAMATGAYPIVSPLETICSVVDAENVSFARNLYPQEIAEALVRAMTDDALVDAAAARNLERVRTLADRNTIRRKITAEYARIACA